MNIDDIIEQLEELHIVHSGELQELINRQTEERARLRQRLSQGRTATQGTVTAANTRRQGRPPQTGRERRPPQAERVRRPFNRFRDTGGRALAIGDTARLLTSGANGQVGDTVKVVRFGEEFVIVRLADGRTTTRLSQNLRLVFN